MSTLFVIAYGIKVIIRPETKAPTLQHLISAVSEIDSSESSKELLEFLYF